MAFTLTPQTALDAVNMMLLSIGQSPVDTITNTGIKDVNTSYLVLQNTAREVLTKGWTFNTDYNYPITPDNNNRILVPSDALTIDVTNGDDWVQRYCGAPTSAMCLYDLIHQTFDRTAILYCDIVRFYDFEKMPQSARAYIALKAARKFQAGAVGSDLLYKFDEASEAEALVTFMADQTRVGGRNILRGPDAVNQIIQRRTNPRF